MMPLAQLHTLTPDLPLFQALEQMTREDINQMPVVSNGNLLGVLKSRKPAPDHPQPHRTERQLILRSREQKPSSKPASNRRCRKRDRRK